MVQSALTKKSMASRLFLTASTTFIVSFFLSFSHTLLEAISASSKLFCDQESSGVFFLFVAAKMRLLEWNPKHFVPERTISVLGRLTRSRCLRRCRQQDRVCLNDLQWKVDISYSICYLLVFF